MSKRKLTVEAGQRLEKLRKQLNLSRSQMAGRLDMSEAGYGKNENGTNFLRMEALQMLQDQFDISMDWMILNRGPMRYSVKIKETEMEKESQRLKEEAKRLERMNERAVKFAELQEVMPDAPELLEYMAKDPELRHQLLLQFYKYKKQNSGPIMENHT